MTDKLYAVCLNDYSMAESEVVKETKGTYKVKLYALEQTVNKSSMVCGEHYFFVSCKAAFQFIKSSIQGKIRSNEYEMTALKEKNEKYRKNLALVDRALARLAEEQL